MKLGAFDLIVKPFTKPQVLESVLKAKEMLERERPILNRCGGWSRSCGRACLICLKGMRLLIRYGSRQQHLSQQWDFYAITMNSRDFCVLVAEIDFFAERTAALPVSEVELIRFAVQNILEETVAAYTQGLVFREHVNQFVIVMNPPAELDAEQLAEKCRENVCRHTYQTVSIGLGGEVEEAGQLSVSYAQAVVCAGKHVSDRREQRIPLCGITGGGCRPAPVLLRQREGAALLPAFGQSGQSGGAARRHLE